MKVSVLCIRVSAGRGLWLHLLIYISGTAFQVAILDSAFIFFLIFLLLNWSGNLIRAAEIQWRKSLITAGWRNSADLLNSPTWGQLRKSSDCSHESSLGKTYHPPEVIFTEQLSPGRSCLPWKLWKATNIGVGNHSKATLKPLLDFIQPLTRIYENIDLWFECHEPLFSFKVFLPIRQRKSTGLGVRKPGLRSRWDSSSIWIWTSLLIKWYDSLPVPACLGIKCKSDNPSEHSLQM